MRERGERQEEMHDDDGNVRPEDTSTTAKVLGRARELYGKTGHSIPRSQLVQLTDSPSRL